MPSEGSVTQYIAQAKDGQSAGVEGLWRRYFPQLVQLAREQIRGVPRGMADEEDVALSVLDSVCRAAKHGRFSDLAGRDDLWRLLFQKTVHKAVDLARHERRQRRGGGRVQSLTASDDFVDVLGKEPTPEFVAMMDEECRRLLETLDDSQLRQLALFRMQGYSNKEVAQLLGCSLRTVERRLRLIRRQWQQEVK